ncbi:unnamed protein product [Kuraishia capsulata CBS 1993]|uniref:Lysophospholipase n=1 Tax=Kuraishia capsulata CBS 1993 TaxID=1382522 RepID=W6MS31_9ASCO|nr:uncharacterized protein KUCA_T00000596001 [Kuraishia capsulata CBS 1993]CDK24630.1 unnamed protein product [Kuraishia capsulata CBS 1993]
MTFVRRAETISPQEKAFLRKKQVVTANALSALFERLAIPGLKYKDVLNSSVPQIAIAVSGGGYRSMLVGAGVLAAFDNRTVNSTRGSGLGGILQASTYLAGISGGSWLVSSLMMYDFASVVKLRDMDSWLLNEPLLEGVPNFEVEISGTNIMNLKSPVADSGTMDKGDTKSDTKAQSSLAGIMNKLLKEQDSDSNTDIQKSILRYYKEIMAEVRPKKHAGYKVSLTDYWGAALAKKIFPRSPQTVGRTFSGISRMESFKQGGAPLPILVSNCKNGAANSASLDSMLMEFNPYEFGSWEPYLNAFSRLSYLGTELYNGKLSSSENSTGQRICYSGFDNAGFVTGTSSSLFNSVLLYLWQIASSSEEETFMAIKDILSVFSLSGDGKPGKSDYALYEPNPFLGLSHINQTSSIVGDKTLKLVDGGEDGQNIPFFPFTQSSREVDVIFAVDSSNDSENWPNGTSLIKPSKRYNSRNKTWEFTTMKIPNKKTNRMLEYTTFPLSPSYKEMSDKGYNKKPVFFGCNITGGYTLLSNASLTANSTSSYEEEDVWLSPLIVYLSNTDLSYASNTSTFKLTYTHDEMSKMITNGYNVATQSNSSYFSQCVGCAVMKRSFDRETIKQGLLFERHQPHIPEVCSKCFKELCYN